MVAIVLVSLWAVMGARARRLLQEDGSLFKSAAGGLLIAGAIELALARRP
jgi:threonine/homoserine/homoserine lactone efflux protein